MADRALNFSAGPAGLPDAVLQKAAEEMLNWHGSGVGVMEMSHRSKEFKEILDQSVADIKALLSIPDNYEILFLQGGGTGQFAAVPLNLITAEKNSADYLVTGLWSSLAVEEATKYCQVNVLANTKGENGFTSLPDASSYGAKLNPNAAYVYVCTNETVNGVQFPWDLLPNTGSVPLVADMSSEILSRGVDISRFGVIYCGAQKNMGPSGVTLVIVRKDLLGHALGITPTVLNWTVMAANGSMPNTPPTYGIYLIGLYMAWLRQQGGIAEMETRSTIKSSMIYEFIDNSNGFYRSLVEKRSRSKMNVTFRLGNKDLEAKFVAESKAKRMLGLEGHRSTGGIRASIYNAVTVEDVTKLVEFMTTFMAANSTA